MVLTISVALCAQNKGEPGKFDFYLLDMPWGPEFCSIADVSSQCKPQHSFVVHGLWPQNNDGSYPVFCSSESGPVHPRDNLDITPDLHLLGHEWQKHGTCSAQGPQRYFAMAREAFGSIHLPPSMSNVAQERRITPGRLLDVFYQSNPQLPQGSLVVSCRDEHLTAVEACFSKALKPMPCLGIRSCAESSIKIEPSARR